MKNYDVNKIIKRKGKQPFFSFIKFVFLRMFFRKPKKIINLNTEPIADKSILLSNHAAKWGPMYLEVRFPKKHALWGAHGMLGNYKERFHYLRDVYYMQKCKVKKGKASFKAAFEAFFSIYFYRGMRIIPTYQDMRMAKTIMDTVKIIEAGLPVMIFPENSNDGYKYEITECHPGVTMLLDRYYKATKEDLPVYPIYVALKKRTIIIGKPIYYQEMLSNGLNKEEVLKEFTKQINNLYINYVK